MASVTFPAELGGNGQTYTDDADPDTGLDGLGYTVRFIPCLQQAVAMGLSAQSNAQACADYVQQCQTLREEVGADRQAVADDRNHVDQQKGLVDTAAATAIQKAEQTGQDALSTAADVVQTGQDRTATGEDRVATGQDRDAAEQAANTAVQKAQETGLDRTQTGLDRTAAAGSAQAAGTSESNAAAALSDFLKRYLGPHEVAPTTDSNGDPLLVGALYLSTDAGDEGMRYWTGTAWVNAYATIDGVSWSEVSNKPELYTKTEVDTMIGDIGAILDEINGVAA